MELRRENARHEPRRATSESTRDAARDRLFTIRPARPTMRRPWRTWSASWRSTRSWSSTRRRRPTTSAGTSSARGPRPRPPWPRSKGSRSASPSGSPTSRRSEASPGSTSRISSSGRNSAAGGSARRCWRSLARLAVERGCGRLEWSVLDWNAPAIAFYRALGARPMDEWTVYRLDDEPLRRLAARPRTLTVDDDPRGPERDEPLLSSEHRADGRLCAGRAAARRRIHQAEHQRESVSALAPGQGGDRRGGDRPAPPLSRPDVHRVLPDRRPAARGRARDGPGGQRVGRHPDDRHPRLHRAGRPGGLRRRRAICSTRRCSSSRTAAP